MFVNSKSFNLYMNTYRNQFLLLKFLINQNQIKFQKGTNKLAIYTNDSQLTQFKQNTNLNLR